MKQPGQKESKYYPPIARWAGLRTHMAISYIIMTVAIVFILLFIGGMLVFFILNNSSVTDETAKNRAIHTAQLYTLTALALAEGGTLDPQSTFEPNHATSLTLPGEQEDDHWYTNRSERFWQSDEDMTVPFIDSTDGTVNNNNSVSIALLISPEGQIITSSYPARYPIQTPAHIHVPNEVKTLITNALAGQQDSTVLVTKQGRIAVTAVPIQNKAGETIGSIFVQLPPTVPNTFSGFFTTIWLRVGLVLIIVTIPIGFLFGILTTSGLVRRILKLTHVTERFGEGQYDQRIAVKKHDELGQLEQRFNLMATRLVESLEQQQVLTERNTRLEERTRIARDLHDSVKQQIFAASMQIGAALSGAGGQEKVRQHLIEADTLTYQAQQELTTLIRELRPSALQRQRFSSALHEYVTTWDRQNKVAAHLRILNECVLLPTLEEALLRIIQEALANVAKHSRATQVQIELECGNELVALSINDNGQGFDPGTIQSGVGLASMRERMEALGGTLTIQSMPGEGTQVKALYSRPDQISKREAENQHG